jgi:restriction system protein
MKGFIMATRKTGKGPQFVRFLGPLLDALRKLGGSATPEEAVDQIAKDLGITDAEQDEKSASGVPIFYNRVAWARFYLVRDGMLDSSKRGVWSLTDKGRTATLTQEQAKDIFLRLAKVFRVQRVPKTDVEESENEQITEEAINSPINYREQLIQLLLSLPAKGFERLAQRILRESGFTQVVVTGQSGDGGIDGNGTLQINPLLSFKVLFQCKRYKETVAPTHVRDFRGAMAGRADKGIILTTGTFSTEARREASRDGVPPIELIDGEKLVDLLERLELGLKPMTTYELDTNFFNEFK